MAEDWSEIGCDFKVVFIHDEPEKIKEDAHKLLTDALSDQQFAMDGNQTALASVAQPRIFNPTDENGTDVEELEPRIEFYIGIADKFKAIGCVFVLEHLMDCLRKNQSKQLRYLRYRVEFRPPSGTDFAPFKRHLSASDTAQMRRILLGNVLWHNQLYVHSVVKSNRESIEQILANDVRQLHVSSPTVGGRKNSTNNGGRTIVGQSFGVGAPLVRQNGVTIPIKPVMESAKCSPENVTISGKRQTRRGQNDAIAPGTKMDQPFENRSNNKIDAAGNVIRPLIAAKDSGVILNGQDYDEMDGIVPGWSTPPPAEEDQDTEKTSKTSNTKKPSTKKMRKPKQLQLSDGRFVEYGMKANFEHDMQMLSLTFFMPFENQKEWPRVDKYKMEIRYSSISQVLMTLKRKGRARFGLRLLLRLQYPPTVWFVEDVFGMKDRFTKDKRSSRGLRVLGWANPSEGAASKAAVTEDLKDSPVIVLELSAMHAGELSALLNRFMVELKMNVELRNLNESRHRNRPNIALDPDFYEHPQLLYWVEALATRGYVVMDHWTDATECDDFFNQLILTEFKKNPEQTLEALEMLADKLLDRTEIKHHFGLGGLLMDIIAGVTANENYVSPLRDGYERVKKVLITPSRIIPCGHEILMGNRALRFDRDNFPPEKFLRVIFRDENLEKVRRNNVNGWLLDRFVLDRLIRGISLAGQVYSFVGTSNSQMRDGGCYFLQADLDKVEEFRNRLGQFSLVPTIPKMMSRLGLCFTQGRETAVDMRLRMLAWDFTGGCNQFGDLYTFSDGCGCLSLDAARKISDEIGLDEQSPPSCFQFRYAGFKGVLAVNPLLDLNQQFCDAVGINTLESGEAFMAVDFLLRPSQKKFEVWQCFENDCRLDIVKCSAPTGVLLNKPLINILDQVSKIQSDRCHRRICTRIHALLDKHIFAVCASLTDEVYARRRLQELPRLIEYDSINSIQFTREPFFRLVLRSAAKVAIHKVCQKLSIAIPHELGRMMFGVIDETGILQYGQVFAQYSVDMDGSLNEFGWRNRRTKKCPSKKRILTGSVMITKNPSIVGGDVRMFEAVDVIALRHLVDVLVFPRYGPRPHSDEMAGSDLDGDEYTIIWDDELMLDSTQPAADYSAPKGDPTLTDKMSPDEYQRGMSSFLVKYLNNDSVGQISNSHLANSDLYGIQSDVCATIAKKHSQAVDFPKTGVPPAQLTKQWNEQADIPPEKYERAPDFMGKMCNEPHYVSNHLNAQLYRRIKALSDFLLNTISDESVKLPNMDELLLSLDEHQEYIELAVVHYQKYAYSIRSLMDSYGILCEGELFSSCYSSLCNRISDRENDDMSFFTTSRVIEQRLWDIRLAARKTFFGSFGGDMDLLTDEDGFCKEPSEQLKFLACAYYTIGYNSMSRKFLSFPWVASWDVLDAVRRSRMMASLGQPNGGCSGLFSAMFDSFGERISEHIERYVSARPAQLDAFSVRCLGTNQTLTEEGEEAEDVTIKRLLNRYVLRHEGLASLMFFCVSWANHMRLFELSPLKEEHICLLLLGAGLMNQPQNVLNSEERRPWLTATPADWVESEDTPRRAVTRPGRRFSSFVESLASRHFEQLPSLDFTHLDLETTAFMFMGEWRELHRIALKTYYSLVFMDQDMHVLPPIDETVDGEPQSVDDDGRMSGNAEPIIKQGEVFVIELPCRVDSEYMLLSSKLRVQLCAQTGCHKVILRRHPRSLVSARPAFVKALHSSAVPRVQKPIRVLVSSWGSREALEQLRQFFTVRPQLNLTCNRRLRIQILPEETFEKLDKLANGGIREREERLGEEALNEYLSEEDTAAVLDRIGELQFVEDDGEESDVMSDD